MKLLILFTFLITIDSEIAFVLVLFTMVKLAIFRPHYTLYGRVVQKTKIITKPICCLITTKTYCKFQLDR